MTHLASGASSIDFSDYIEERARDFSHRDWIFGILNEWLTTSGGSRFFIITGAPGAGKTAISARLAQLTNGKCAPPQGLAALCMGFLSAIHFCWYRESRWLNPKVFSSSLSLQLAHRYPAYAKALLESADARPIRVNVNVNVGHATQVTGLSIGSIDIGDTTAEDAFMGLVREPLEKLFNSGFDGQITILIDAVDEALDYEGKVGIVSLISRAEKMPAGVRFILTCRPDVSRLLPLRLGSTSEHSLTSGSGLISSRDDIKEHVLQAYTKSPEFLRRLAADLTPDALAGWVSDKSKGNFLYVKHLLQMVSASERIIDLGFIQTLPEGLDGIYREFLARLTSSKIDEWVSQYAPLLGILSVAKASLTETELANFVITDVPHVRHILTNSRQFLDVDDSLPASKRQYALYHRSLGDFLLDRDRAETYWCDTKLCHNRIVQYYRAANGSPTHLDYSRLDLYAWRYLPDHLLGAEQYEMLFSVGRDKSFLDQQDRLLVGDPDASIATLQNALLGAVRADKPAEIVEFVLMCASRVAQLRQQSLLEITRSGDWEQARRLLDVMPVKTRVLWALLLAAEHLDHGHNSEATEVMRSLLRIKLPHLVRWEAPFAAECLADLSEVDREAFRDLADRLFGEHNPDSFLQTLLVRGHSDAALERARSRGSWLDVQNVLRHDIEQQIKIGDYTAAWRILFSVTGFDRPACGADIAHAQSAAGNTMAALEQLALLPPSERVEAFIKLAQMTEKLGELAARDMLQKARETIPEVEDNNRLRVFVDAVVAQGLQGEKLKSSRELIDLLEAQPTLPDDWRVLIITCLAKLDNTLAVRDLLRKHYLSKSLSFPYTWNISELLGELCRLNLTREAMEIAEHVPTGERTLILHNIVEAQIRLGQLEAALQTMNGMNDAHLAAKYAKRLLELGRSDSFGSYLRGQTREECKSAVLASEASFKSEAGDLAGATATLNQIKEYGWKVTAIREIVEGLVTRNQLEEALMIAAKNDCDYDYTWGAYPHLMRTVASKQWITGDRDRCRSTMAAVLMKFATLHAKLQSTGAVAAIASARIQAHDWQQADRIIPLIQDEERRNEVRAEYIEARLASKEFEVVAQMAAATTDMKELDGLLLSLAKSQAKAGLLDDALETAESLPSYLSLIDALGTIAPALSRANRDEDAEYAVNAAMEIIRKLPQHAAILAMTYSKLGLIQHELHADQVALTTLMSARDAAQRVEDPKLRVYLLREIGEELASVGARDVAIATFMDAASVFGFNESSFLFDLQWITEAMVRADLVQEALNLIDASDFISRSGMFQSLIEALLKKEAYGRALAIAVQRGGVELPRAINAIVEAHAMRGRFAEAFQAAENLRGDSSNFEEALYIISCALADQGDSKRALDTIASVKSGYYRAVSFAHIAVAQFKDGKKELGHATLGAALNGARSLSERSKGPAGGFEHIARAFLQIGDLRGAADAALEDAHGYNRSEVLAEIAFAMCKEGQIAEGCNLVLELPDKREDTLIRCADLMAKNSLKEALMQLLPLAAQNELTATSICVNLGAIYGGWATTIAQILASREGATNLLSSSNFHTTR
jgi:hypothetical protein